VIDVAAAKETIRLADKCPYCTYAADAYAEADRWAQKVIDRINKLKEKNT
jgi:hypothetical protein